MLLQAFRILRHADTTRPEVKEFQVGDYEFQIQYVRTDHY